MVSSGRTICPSLRPGPIVLVNGRGSWSFANFLILFAATRIAERSSRFNPDAAAVNSACGTATVFRVRPSNLRAYSISAASPCVRTASRMGRTTASASAHRAARRFRMRSTWRLSTIRIIFRLIRVHSRLFAAKSHSRPDPVFSHHDLVQRILHDPLRAGFLQPRDDGAHRRFIQDRVHRQPVLVAQV